MAQPRARPEIEALSSLGVIQAQLCSRMERALPGGVSAAAFEAMDRLAAANPPQGPAELALALGLSRAALSNTLANLERAGWMTVKPHSDDGRRKRLSLTPAGADMHRRCLFATRPQLENLRAAISGEAAEAALPFLRSLSAWLTRS